MKLDILNKLLMIAVVSCDEDMQKIFAQSESITITDIDVKKNMATIVNKSSAEELSVNVQLKNAKLFASLVKDFDDNGSINKVKVDALKLNVSDLEISKFMSEKAITEKGEFLNRIEKFFTLNSESNFYLTYYAIYDGKYPEKFTNMDKGEYSKYISNHTSLFTENCVKKFEDFEFSLEEMKKIKETMLHKEDLFFPRAANVYKCLSNKIFEFISLKRGLKKDLIYSCRDFHCNLTIPGNKEKIKGIFENFQLIYENGLANLLREETISHFLTLVDDVILYKMEDIEFHEVLIELLRLSPQSEKIAYSIPFLPHFLYELHDITNLIYTINFLSLQINNEELDSEKCYHPYIFELINMIEVTHLRFSDLIKLLKNVLPRRYRGESQNLWEPFFNKVYDCIHTNFKTDLEKNELVYTMIFYPGNDYFSELYKLKRNDNDFNPSYLNDAADTNFERLEYIKNLNKLYESYDSVSLNS